MNERYLFCGDRNWKNYRLIQTVLAGLRWDHNGRPCYPTIITGGAHGADSIAFECATNQGAATEVYNAEWDKYGKAAGPIRNQTMLDTGIYAVYAFHNNIEQSKGTKHMVTIAKRAGVPVYLIREYNAPSEEEVEQARLALIDMESELL